MRLPQGYGTITKLSGNRRRPYWVRLGCQYSSDGQKLTETRPTLGYYATKAEALEALHNYHKNPFDVSSKSTFGEIFSKWLDEKAPKVSTQTIKSYMSAFTHCSPIHNKPLSDLRLNDYQQIMDNVSSQSASTVNNVRIILSGVSAYGIRYELISKDYTQYITTTHAEKTNKHKPFTAAEIKQLWDMPQCKERDITLILLYSGWRITELLDMPRENIDLTARTFTGGNKTTAGKNRLVPIQSQIYALVERYAADSVPFDVSYQTMIRWIKAHTVHIPHDTRHTFITELQRRGADKICIKRLVGHASSDITDAVYTHKDIADLRQTVELIAYKDIQMIAV